MVVFPALLAAGLSPLTANTTSNLISWPGALSSAYGYRKQLRKLPAKYLLLLVPCFIGAIIGSVLLVRTDSSDNQSEGDNKIVYYERADALSPSSSSVTTK